MKVLVATAETQGQRGNDFRHTREGELVYFGSRCTRGSTDDGCGCYRSMVGAETLKATTTVKVVDLPLTRRAWVEAIVAGEVKGGWGTAAECRPSATGMVLRIAEAVGAFPVGTVLEFRDDTFAARRLG